MEIVVTAFFYTQKRNRKLFVAPRFFLLWLWVASKRVASSGYRARDEDWQDTQHKDDHQRSNQDQSGLRVAKIQGPPKAVALFDKQSRTRTRTIRSPQISKKMSPDTLIDIPPSKQGDVESQTFHYGKRKLQAIPKLRRG